MLAEALELVSCGVVVLGIGWMCYDIGKRAGGQARGEG